MAENENKTEKKVVEVHFGFILFLVYLIFSVAYIFSLHAQIDTLKEQVATAEQAVQDTLTNQSSLRDSLRAELEKIIDVYLTEKQENNSVEVSVGTYSAAVASGDEAPAMVLALAEDNVATLTFANVSGDSSLSGTYAVNENVLVFTSQDGLTTYSFAVAEDGSLSYDGTVLTLNS